MQQPKQRPFVRFQLLCRMALNSRNDPADEPARLAHLDDGDQRAILIQSGEASAQVIRLRHRALRRFSLQRRLCLHLVARPIASLEAHTLMPACRRSARPGSARTSAETAVELAVLADKYGLDRRLYVVVDAPRAGASVTLKGASMGIEHYLLALARISPHEWHPAVAEPDMRHLDGDRHAVHQYDLVAPVELVGLTRRKAQRHIGLRRRARVRSKPHPRVVANGVIAALVTEPSQLPRIPD